MELKKDLVEQYLNKWQDILRIRDWDIKIELVDKEWRKSGDIKIDRDVKQAVLMINNFNRKHTNLEALVIHELIHLKLWGMDQMIESLVYSVFGKDESDPKFEFAYTQFMQKLESTVEDLTKAYVYTGAEDKEISFGRVQKEVEKELGGI
ncbi:hypothetical protein [Paraclostridium bifermentans]|uniref:hypothetical protein n=1 Tax=Paraclostridium bifermentans TaxID=1490 RepID=UPI001898D9C3|nr:hypothetical protein [Paraclostridium bifermentans]MBS5954936.1 hypothetical protein [Paraclostridium bifermentans]MBU5290042.1 hypothetical protein [Paraclostridium bifermentans]